MKILCTIAAFFAFTTALAGDLEDGVSAYVKKNFATALAKFRSAALRGNRDAQTAIGNVYAEGVGTTQDFKEAVHWYRLAAAQGDSTANRTSTAYGTRVYGKQLHKV